MFRLLLCCEGLAAAVAALRGMLAELDTSRKMPTLNGNSEKKTQSSVKNDQNNNIQQSLYSIRLLRLDSG